MTLLEELKIFSLERVFKLTCKHQCCGSGMFIPEPGSKNSNIREWLNKFVVIPFLIATNFTKL
jgi:hypothetical protein